MKSNILVVLLVGAAVAAAAVVLLARMGRDTASLENGEGRKVTLMLDWTPNVNHVGIYVARERGFFAREGLAVDIVQPGEVYAPAAVLGGVADFGVDFQEYLTLLAAEQSGLVSVAAIFQSNTSGFAVRSADRVESVEALNGRRYGTFQSPFERPTIEALLRCRGVQEIDVDYVPAGTDLLALLSADQSDFVWIYWGTQGFQARRLGIEIDYFPLSDYTECIPDYYSPIIISSRELITSDPELVRSFVRALRLAHQFVADNPRESATILNTALPELALGEIEMSIAWLSQYMLHPVRGWGYQEAEKWERYAMWMEEHSIIARRPPVEELFTNDFVE